jgi:uncharacterized protein (TIGR00661 family)
MKIWYAVNATGNGHITRGRVMAKELKSAGIEVDFMFSGRPPDKLFDMEVFGNYQTRKGVTFNIHKGKVDSYKTIIEMDVSTMWKDIANLQLSSYDLVISDYEPVTAWAAKQQEIPVIGIGHQYAFNYDIPIKGGNCITKGIMKNFAPVTTGVGLHWHHFNQPILPPIIDLPHLPEYTTKTIIVYLPFEDQQEVIQMLSKIRGFEFHVYTSENIKSTYDHIKHYTPSRDGFQNDLLHSVGVICNAGFELVSEALQLGKKILVKPVQAQMEQLSNAEALTQLQYGYSMIWLDREMVKYWLYDTKATIISYPNTAKMLVEKMQSGGLDLSTAEIIKFWENVTVSDLSCY